MEKIAPQDKKKKTVATLTHPMIASVVGGHYRFKTLKDACEKIAILKDRFLQSRQTPESATQNAIFWIKGFGLTDKETETGYTGNFALVHITEDVNGRFSLNTTKLEVELKQHPQRNRPLGKHPDWGYHVLRKIKKGWRYDTMEEAAEDLARIAEDFPKVSIPGGTKLFTILYRKAEDGSLPLMRYAFEVKPLAEGGVTITYRENPRKTTGPQKPAEPKETDSAGYFTSMVTLKRKSKKPKPSA